MNSARQDNKNPTTLDALARAAVRIFRPLVRILLRHHVSYKTCAEWLRWCYADVAHHEFALPDRKQSKSRVAVLTGLTRTDVNRVLAMPAPDASRQEELYHRAAQVLNGWNTDPDFQHQGRPVRTLPFEAEDGAISFSLLVTRHSGGAPARAVLDELEGNGTVRVLPDRSIELLRRNYITFADANDIEHSEVLGMACGKLAETVDHNWRSDRRDKRLQLLVYNASIHPELADQARAHVEDAARDLALQVDEWLEKFEKQSAELDRSRSGKERVCLGLGLYYFE
ncbi:MAG: DUF6502 family protein [Wenzhouxiangellaceae bacterium]|nr:DUF6502 family protein [Wenzhouxiangellaceae bacterium]